MTETLAQLTCPKCGASMRSYERNGVTVDQCTECRGIYLDRGELERLIDAEQAHYAAAAPPAPAAPQYEQPRYQEPRHERPRCEQPRYDSHSQYGYGKKKRKRESFLSELFD